MFKLISIVVPAYNAEKTIESTILSLINQTYKEIEIIIIDDGSNDLTKAICKRLMKSDKRIKYIYKNNTGVSETRNRGIMEANGELLCFVDSDDLLPANAIYDMEKAMGDDIDLVCGAYVETKLKLKKKHKIENSTMAVNSMLETFDKYYMNFAGPWGKIFRNNIIKDNKLTFRKNISYGEDTIFIFNYLEKSNKIRLIDKYVYNHVINFQGLCSKFYPDMDYISFEIYKAFKDLAKVYGIKDEIVYVFSKRYYFQAVNHYLLKVSSKEELVENIRRTNILFRDNIDNSIIVDDTKIDEYIDEWKRKHRKDLVLYRIKGRLLK
ncbi:MAG: glycosyltransferase family 2 protein [Clostridiales bacterium]|nr:glycosyltransferase family 2 protein [Clostridiales bacterium]